MFTLSGALTALGVPLALAYLLWKPVAVAILFLGAARTAARAFPDQAGQRLAALALGLLCFLPAAALVGWSSAGATPNGSGLLTLGGELFPAGELWGYLPSAVAIGLMPIAILAAERAILSAPGNVQWPATAALAGALVAWLHPWQGATVELVLIGLVAVPPRRQALLRLSLPIFATALPLAYYKLLAAHDPAWHLAAGNELVPHLPFVDLLVGLVPVLAVAATGLRRPDGTPFERALLLWVPAGLAVYFALDSYPTHSLESLSLPLAILAVRGFARLGASAVACLAVVLLLVIPGLVYEVEGFADAPASLHQLLLVNPSNARALDWMAGKAPPGGVLARTLFALVIPAQTGRQVWVGHQFWSRDYSRRSVLAEALFTGRLAAGPAQALVLASGARLLAEDCTAAPGVLRELRPVLVTTRHFGCASVSVIARAGNPAGPQGRQALGAVPPSPTGQATPVPPRPQ
jgi:hypothetical protein